MTLKLLYIEDDIIDVLAVKRLLKQYEKVELTVCGTLNETRSLDLEIYDAILSDSNLPDADFNALKAFLPNTKTQFISGSNVVGENIWIKPIQLEQIKSLIEGNNVVNMKYINGLADGDDDYVQEMLETALEVLPKRWDELFASSDSLVALKKAAHKTKSSYRVCGISNNLLVEIEDLNENTFKSSRKNELLTEVQNQITQAITELKKIKS